MAHPLSCLTPEVLLLRSYPLKYKVMETNNLAYQGGKKKKLSHQSGEKNF